MAKRRSARARMQIYFDILQAIQEELTNGEVKPTRIQFKSNLSYDNLLSHLKELEKMKMISRNPILLTEKAKSFIQDFDKMNNYFNYFNLKTSHKVDETENLVIDADEKKIKQVLTNLIFNSIQFTNNGSIRIETHITKSNKLEFKIIDSGPRTENEILPRLVSKIVTKNIGDLSYQGSGSGLFISKGITAKHD